MIDEDLKHKGTSGVDEALYGYGVTKNDRILFLGRKYISLCVKLNESGFRNLYLLDSDRDIYNNPNYVSIRYIYQKNMDMHFPPQFFRAIIVNNSDYDEKLKILVADKGIILVSGYTAKSDVIETNGVQQIRMAEAPYLSSRKHCFQKINEIDTTYNFQIVNVDNRMPNGSVPGKLDILCYSGKEEGIYIHSKILKERLETEYCITVNLTDIAQSVQSHVVIVEYHPGYGHFERLSEDVLSLLNQNVKVILENHGSLRKFSDSLKILIDKGLIVTYRSPEIAELDHIERYSILPVLSYKNINLQKPVKIDGIRFGTFGFIGKQKGTEDIISLAFKLKIHATILLGVSPADLGAEKKILDFERKYGKRKNISIRIYERQISYNANSLVEVLIGNHSDEDIIDAMSRCSHIAFAHRTRLEESGAIKYAKRLSKPIFALDSYQARIGQVKRFSKFTNLTPIRVFKDSLIEALLSYFRGELGFAKLVKSIATIFVKQIKVILHGDYPNAESLKEMQTELFRDEDGLDYLMAILS